MIMTMKVMIMISNDNNEMINNEEEMMIMKIMKEMIMNKKIMNV